MNSPLTEIERLMTEKENWTETARVHLNNENYYRDIVRSIGKLFGEEARTCDDGTISEDVLCAKVFSLVTELKRKFDDR